MEIAYSVLKRYVRVMIAVVLAGLPYYFSGNPRYILLAPVINALGKYLRKRFGLINIPF